MGGYETRKREMRIMSPCISRPRSERESNIKIDLKDMVCTDVKWLRIKTHGVLL